jgi:hypothetical protein
VRCGLVGESNEEPVDLTKLSREDWMVGAGGVLLALGLLAFPWSSVAVGPVTLTLAATAGSGGIWASLALLDLALARLSPATVVPTTQLGRETTRAAAAGVIALLMFTRLLAHSGSYGWGFYADVILVIAVTAGAWLNAQGHATPAAPRGQLWREERPRMRPPRRASRVGQ